MSNERAFPENLATKDLRNRQSERFLALLTEVHAGNPFWKKKYQAAGIHIADIRTLDDLNKLPTCEKSELIADQEAHPPYGTNLTSEPSKYSRLHQTSGTTGHPLRWLDTPASWSWLMDCWAQIFRIVGLRADDRLGFPFSFGPFLGFWAAFDGANRLGNLCLAGGGMSSQARLSLILDNRATIVCCTPTYALRLAEVADHERLDLATSAVRALIVAGEPGGSIAATRERIESAWGARVFDHWGMTELGALAVECVENPGGLHILETECIAEIVKPGTTEQVASGQLGELLITNLGRTGSPLIRYRTGDLVEADTHPCSCGRNLLRLRGGILGRVDDMITIRGNNVFPSTLEAILRRFDDIAEFRITLESRRAMQHLKIEIEPINTAVDAELSKRVAHNIKDRLNFQVEVITVAQGVLPRFEMKGRRFVRNDSL